MKHLLRSAALAGLLSLTITPAVEAQGLVSGGKGGIAIEADDGIEWIRNEAEKTGEYRARGNAKATRDGVDVAADELVAFYRTGIDGESQEIYRMDAIGNVVITSGETEAVGDKAVYHLDQRVVVLVGRKLKLISPQATITARESLEYWDEKEIAVARGKATVIQQDKRLQAGVLTAFIRPDKKTGKKEVKRIDATSGVHVSTTSEIVRGREGVYDIDSQVARLCGDVKITRGDNQLNGECATVNMKTGRSDLQGGGGKKVKGLILPAQ